MTAKLPDVAKGELPQLNDNDFEFFEIDYLLYKKARILYKPITL